MSSFTSWSLGVFCLVVVLSGFVLLCVTLCRLCVSLVFLHLLVVLCHFLWDEHESLHRDSRSCRPADGGVFDRTRSGRLDPTCDFWFSAADMPFSQSECPAVKPHHSPHGFLTTVCLSLLHPPCSHIISPVPCHVWTDRIRRFGLNIRCGQEVSQHFSLFTNKCCSWELRQCWVDERAHAHDADNDDYDDEERWHSTGSLQVSCRVMVGVELSGGPAKPPRWAFRLGRHRGCTGKTRTFDSTAAVVQTELTSSRETAWAHWNVLRRAERWVSQRDL